MIHGKKNWRLAKMRNVMRVLMSPIKIKGISLERKYKYI